jgi:alpha-pyrone synthase
MATYLSAIGTANPKHKRSQASAADFLANLMGLKGKMREKLLTLFLNSGIHYRYSVIADYTLEPDEFTFFSTTEDFEPFPTTSARMTIYKTEAVELAIAAIINCINQMIDFSLSEVTHLITVSCTGMHSPGIDIEIIKRLNLNTQTQRIAINFMGCYGAFIGLKTAKAICASDTNATVLVVCVELCSLHVQKKPDLDNMLANLLFADGAAATIIQSETKQKLALVLENFHSELLPDTHNDMTWQIGDQGFEMSLSAYVPRIINAGIDKFCQGLFAKMDYKISDIDFFAIHPGGKKILEACENALGITAGDNRYAYSILEQFGNMSSGTVLFVLAAIMQDLREHDNDKKILGLGFGPGLTLESMLLRVASQRS